MKSHSQRGVALIITLIMLSVITVLVVALLALAGREKRSMGQTANATDAEYAADTARERAVAEILAPILTSTNLLGFDPRISINFYNVDGFDSRVAGFPPALTNVNFDYNYLGQTNSLSELIGNIANLSWDPRVPVFINTNRGNSTGPNEFRYYLDLNRNGRFEETGIYPVINNNGQPVRGTNGSGLTGYFLGDPQWIGILQHPNAVHSKDNKFIGRYAYVILPVGKMLDLNFIHNNAKGLLMNRPSPAGSGQLNNGYLRNQGFGSWEINLASFLTDLNTNQWNRTPYFYDINSLVPNVNTSKGDGFEDATDLLLYRYTRLDLGTPVFPLSQSAHLSLPSASQMLPDDTNSLLSNDFLDMYVRNAQSPFGQNTAPDLDDPTQPWMGADGKRHFFTMDDFFNQKSAFYPNFLYRLMTASTAPSSYDRYTFYRLLSQLGTDSVPEKEDSRINLNYDNSTNNPNFGRPLSATNFVKWEPVHFFTNVVERLLRQEFTNFGVANIPVFTNNTARFTNSLGAHQPIFSPRVRQLLQVAANLYDATTSDRLPTVFRPQFDVRGNNNDVYITGFVEETNIVSITDGRRWHDLSNPADRAALKTYPDDYAYNVSVIVGAKKGLPNFNQFRMLTCVEVNRKLQFPRRNQGDATPYATNQLFRIAITNYWSTEAWNSYASDYRNPTRLYLDQESSVTLTNDAGMSTTLSSNFQTFKLTNFVWKATNSIVPPMRTQTVLPPSAFYLTDRVTGAYFPHFELIGGNNWFEPNVRSYTNNWGLTATNRLRFFMVDQVTGRLVDAVGLLGLDGVMDISGALDEGINGDQTTSAANIYKRAPFQSGQGISEGVHNQILVSAGAGNGTSDKYWINYALNFANDVKSRDDAIKQFRRVIAYPGSAAYTNVDVYPPEAPFVMVRRIWQTNFWQANDPLVHYTTEDLKDAQVVSNRVITVPTILGGTVTIGLTNGIGNAHPRYRPWGNDPGVPTPYTNAPTFKDSGVISSDYWDFPNQKLPSIGWLGRVHRGTPWQTVYLKSFTNEAIAREWSNHVGAAYMMETHPTNDWGLVDIFTVAQHPNATRGTLSINQTNLASWSAVLGSITVTTLDEPKPGEFAAKSMLLEPAAIAEPLARIVDGLNQQRSKMPGNQFHKLSEVLSTPELTSFSPVLNQPFLPANRAAQTVKDAILSDLDYERIPDQILSLLKLGDTRFVVYGFGQSLKPAANLPGFPSVVTSGANFGLCVNYQITGEVATRAVVRVDFETVTDTTSPNFGKPDYRKPHAVIESFNILPPN